MRLLEIEGLSLLTVGLSQYAECQLHHVPHLPHPYRLLWHSRETNICTELRPHPSFYSDYRFIFYDLLFAKLFQSISEKYKHSVITTQFVMIVKDYKMSHFSVQASKGYIPTLRWVWASAQGQHLGSICETPFSHPQMKRNIQVGPDSG